ncbi:MAG: hypothetical protein J6Q78_05950 [Clostridia bacterium]|nr:hypothetical protein [Clostridia bacterium]
MEQKKQNLTMIVIMAVLAVVGIVLFVFGCVFDGSLFVKISAIITAVICLALAGELAYVTFFAGDMNSNYFLYDAKTKKNVSLQKLTFQTVNARMNRYISYYASSEGKLWTEGVLESPELDMGEEFKPLVAYKLLYDLAEANSENAWKCFEVCGEGTVECICSWIASAGDAEMADNIIKMKQLRPYNGAYIKDYLVRNRKYLQSRMFKYVYENIDKF